MHYDAFLWDFDGTLADTLVSVIGAYNRLALQYQGLPIESPDEIRNFTTEEFLAAHKISLWRLPFLLREFLNAQRDLLDGVELAPGIETVLHQLQRRGLRMAIVSSNNEVNIRIILQRHGVERCFEFVEGYSQLFGKQSAIRHTAEKWNLPCNRMLYIGDEVRDLEAASHAQVDFAAVTWGFHSHELLSRYCPTYLVDHPEELLALAGNLS